MYFIIINALSDRLVNSTTEKHVYSTEAAEADSITYY
jgi:hypothetical protein